MCRCCSSLILADAEPGRCKPLCVEWKRRHAHRRPVPAVEATRQRMCGQAYGLRGGEQLGLAQAARCPEQICIAGTRCTNEGMHPLCATSWRTANFVPRGTGHQTFAFPLLSSLPPFPPPPPYFLACRPIHEQGWTCIAPVCVDARDKSCSLAFCLMPTEGIVNADLVQSIALQIVNYDALDRTRVLITDQESSSPVPSKRRLLLASMAVANQWPNQCTASVAGMLSTKGTSSH